VKDCDKEIQHDLKDKGLLVHAEQYRHDYPFCWRADSDPLIQYARPAWYIRTTAAKDRAIENSRQVDWIPDHIKEGRFGDFLAHNVDWALSRERWWGTPLNVWVCDQDSEHKEAPRSVAEIEARNPEAFEHFHVARKADPTLNEHLIVHKPWIDQVHFPCARCAGTMRRVPEVIDCWFDSGCMPFAQWGYPHAPGSKEKFDRSFPADFISEAIDQTRGWFYSLLMISTLVFDEPVPRPFKTCIVLGHVTDREGKKESKSKGNYTPPEIILDKVAMEFAVVDDAAAKKGVVLVAREDLEGLDLQDGASVKLYRADAPGAALQVALRAGKKLKRRIAVVHADDRASLGVIPMDAPDVLPSAVPRLPADQRVMIEDPATPAPGADAFRWFFYAASPPWSATRHALSNVRDLQKDFAVKLRNVYSFFTIYANIDGFAPGASGDRSGPASSLPELDRWIRGELALTTRTVTACMDQYDVYGATGRLVAFVDALSNWYVRRSRARFWRAGWDDDKKSAYDTLYTCLVDLSRLIAPFTPYAAEAMYQNLVVRGGRPGARESVHLEDWPDAGDAAVDEALSRKMVVVRDLVSVGLRARMDSKVKVRQPRGRATIVLNDDRDRDLVTSAVAMIREELNVLDVALGTPAQRREFGTVAIKPNFRALGQRGLGKIAQELKAAWAAGKGLDVAFAALDAGEAVWEGVRITRDDVEMSFEPRPGFAAATDRVGSLFLDTTLDERLTDLGLVRELQYRVQSLRKELGLEYTERIHVYLVASERVTRIVKEHAEALSAEVLAAGLSFGPPPEGAEVRDVDVEGETVRVGIARVRPPAG
ncbi:MAG: class I tRNA ligase family protein, partial [Polyangiaceae bacterium]